MVVGSIAKPAARAQAAYSLPRSGSGRATFYPHMLGSCLFRSSRSEFVERSPLPVADVLWHVSGTCVAYALINQTTSHLTPTHHSPESPLYDIRTIRRSFVGIHGRTVKILLRQTCELHSTRYCLFKIWRDFKVNRFFNGLQDFIELVNHIWEENLLLQTKLVRLKR